MSNVTVNHQSSEALSDESPAGVEDKLTIGHVVALLVLLLAIGRMVTYFLSTFGMLP